MLAADTGFVSKSESTTIKIDSLSLRAGCPAPLHPHHHAGPVMLDYRNNFHDVVSWVCIEHSCFMQPHFSQQSRPLRPAEHKGLT